MTTKKPTFVERIRLLEDIARLIFERSDDDRLLDAADVINAEVDRMKEANKRFEAQRAAKAERKAKTASKETASTS